ncbi:transcriptional regulator TetR family [Gottschalkia acidurici 9a]|uniref:Transcriptional regulator TetR family n=1 Tax=Gottschalkia acidurici (strain ATCC 7906 / DSM 604 / BCRC 14475 / CIP 104303 / KCTC 5404 / NCIMB 10678 / 9a) TaxID=1128398 RepID=K0B2B4_GOTA9|nr:TetR family transcriptional regulator [Gottschalkia acidurici]AFS79070.1 transcriptional regulator TetR family [Gottschalkia acidurici 9a]
MAVLKEDPRILRTKKLIIDAFISLVKEKDFHSISIKDITNLANINRSTFYSHFSDKYILLEKIVDQMMFHKKFEQVVDKEDLDSDTLRLLVYSFCDFADESKETFKHNYNTVIALTEERVKRIVVNIIVTFLKSKDREQNIMIATMLASSICSASCLWINENKKVPIETFFDQIHPFLMGAIKEII